MIVPTQIVMKPGALTPEELLQVRMHASAGGTILQGLGGRFPEIVTAVRHHHERIDGDGYPDRLRGDEIPLLSRIVAVAEAFDYMVSRLPFRDGVPVRLARLRLAQAAGTQFDPDVVAAFEVILTDIPGRSRLTRQSSSSMHPSDGCLGSRACATTFDTTSSTLHYGSAPKTLS